MEVEMINLDLIQYHILLKYRQEKQINQNPNNNQIDLSVIKQKGRKINKYFYQRKKKIYGN